MYIYKVYEICNQRVEIFDRSLGDNLYIYNAKIQEVAKHIMNYCTLDFFEQAELEKMLNEIKDTNKKALEEKEKINNYIVEE